MSAERSAVVIVASTRAAGGVYPDRTGPILVGWLAERGWAVDAPVVVADGTPVGDALRAALAGADLVLTTGGTGLSPTDRTPEETRAVLDTEVPGLADAIRRSGAEAVPSSALSRGLAGVAGRALVVNLPGSTGGVRDGLAVLDAVLDHAVDQIRGGDHVGSARSSAAGRSADDAGSATATASAPDHHHAHGGHQHPHDHDRARDDLGGAHPRVLLTGVTEAPLDPDACRTAVADASAGAVVDFAGVVRDADEGRGVLTLHYEAHPEAAAVLASVAAEVADRHPEVRIAAVHRVGDLVVGDLALSAAVSSAHRAAAFTACADLIDAIKGAVPIWKEQGFDDGTREWVGSLG